MRTRRRRSSGSAIACALLVAAVAAVAGPVGAGGIVEPTNMGAGVVRGTAAYAPTALPAVGAPCRSVTFSLHVEGLDLAANTVISGYGGPVTLTGAGSGACDSMALGEGVVSVRLHGRNERTGSEVECPVLAGRYARVFADTSVQLVGTCTVNRYGAGVVLLTGRWQLVPDGAGAGVLTSVTTATIVGGFVVVPN